MAYGVAELDVFQTVDLWEKKDISQVTTTIFALGRTVSSIPTTDFISFKFTLTIFFHHQPFVFFLFSSQNRHTSTPSGKDHGWARNPLKKINVNSPMTLLRQAKPLLVSKLEPTKELLKLARTWVPVGRLSWINKLAQSRCYFIWLWILRDFFVAFLKSFLFFCMYFEKKN